MSLGHIYGNTRRIDRKRSKQKPKTLVAHLENRGGNIKLIDLSKYCEELEYEHPIIYSGNLIGAQDALYTYANKNGYNKISISYRKVNRSIEIKYLH